MHFCISLTKFLNWECSFKSFVAESKEFDAVNQDCNLKLHCQLRNFINDMLKCTTTIPTLFVETSRTAYLTNFDKHSRYRYLSERLVIFALFVIKLLQLKNRKWPKNCWSTNAMNDSYQTPESSKYQFFNNKLNFKSFWKRLLDLAHTVPI